MRRDWSLTDATAIAARGCRGCGKTGVPLERAHIIGRARDGGRPLALDVVMLCGPFPHGCHGAYDHRRLDLYPKLTRAELVRAVAVAGGVGEAVQRLSGPSWRTLPAVMDHRITELETCVLTDS